MSRSIRLGVFDFVNIWPVYYSFLFEDKLDSVSLVRGNPTSLNRFLQEGEVDVSCISSIEYPFLQSEISLLPSLALAATGPVKSVLLATRAPLQKLSGGKIFATSASSTSVVLLKILMHSMNVKAEIASVPDPTACFETQGDGCLVIGDEALRFSADSELDANVYDLGDLWFEMTGKPFVWALWGIRSEISGLASQITETLLKSRAEGFNRLDFLSRKAADRLGLGMDCMQAYFKNFNYHLAEKEIEGLLLFYRLASELGLAPSCNHLKLSGRNKVSCP